MTDTEKITPFRVHVPQTVLDDLRGRLAATRWPEHIPGTGWERGVPVSYLKDLAEYWADAYDWREHEAALNALPQFRTRIDGQDIHYIHVRSPHPRAMPLLLVHGWPGSVAEFTKIVEPLTDPADPADAFDLVIPSIPGIAFSGPLHDQGWDAARIARAFTGLMARLGYQRYGVQGGDLGALIAPEAGRAATGNVAGVHVNAATFGFIPLGDVPDDQLATFTDVEKASYARMRDFLSDGNGYFQIMATRPQTVGYGLDDSPAGALAWIAEKFNAWSQADIDRDDVLTNVMLYWATGTIGSSAHLYWENTHSRTWHQDKATTPTGVAVFAEDIAIRRYAEQGNTITHWSEFSRGGHFAALEAPDLLVGDIRAFFRTVRSEPA
jgi:epoxide hydrolase